MVLNVCFVFVYIFISTWMSACVYVCVSLQWHIHLILMSSVQHFVFTEQVFLLTLYYKVNFLCVCESLYCDSNKPSEISNNEWKMNKITSNPVDVLFI